MDMRSVAGLTMAQGLSTAASGVLRQLLAVLIGLTAIKMWLEIGAALWAAQGG